MLLLNGCLREQLLLEGLTLANDFREFSIVKMCVFVSRPMKFVTFPRKNGDSPKRVVDFPLERDTFRTKPWKSSRILTKKVTTTTINPGNRQGFCV